VSEPSKLSTAADRTYVGRRIPTGLVVAIRVSDREVGTLCHYVRHSPTGFECGYNGSGPADLARCILIDHLDLHSLAERESVIPGVDRRYQDFKAEVIAELDPTGFELPGSRVQKWIEEHERQTTREESE
jgi:hypothetical protein